MAKLTHAQASKQVQASAAGLSDRLLVEEERAYRRIAAEFRRTPQVTHRTVRGVRNSMVTRNRWVAAHREVVGNCSDLARQLGGVASRLALEAISAELRAIESALPARYAGVTVRAVDGMLLPPIVNRAVVAFEEAVEPLPGYYRAAQTDALSCARTVEELTARLFSPGPPRGAWWRSCTAVQQQARWLSIAVANAVRLDAMARFNEQEAG